MSDILDFRIDDLPSSQEFRDRSGEIQRRIEQTVDQKVEQSGELITTVGWDTVRDTAYRKLTDGLAQENREVWFTWLAKAWTLSSKLRAAGRETAGDEQAERLIPLKSHPLSQVVHPVVTLICEPLRLELTFDLEIKGVFGGADLVVRGGRLVAVQAASVTPSAALSYREVPLGKKTGKPINLAKTFVLPGGGLKLVDAPDEENVAAE